MDSAKGLENIIRQSRPLPPPSPLTAPAKAVAKPAPNSIASRVGTRQGRMVGRENFTGLKPPAKASLPNEWWLDSTRKALCAQVTYADSHLPICAFTATEDQGELKDPISYAQATSSPQSAQWQRAMKEELLSLLENKTYRLVQLPKGRKSIGSKWVYKTKRDTEGAIARYKARLVAQGFRQVEGLDFHETFAPVARMTSQRILIALAAAEGLELYQVDVKNAYLKGEIDTPIFMKQPPGFEDPKYPAKEGWVWELLKSLYGLKQAGHIWNATLHTFIVELGFKRARSDLCVYIKIHEKTRMAVSIHVDDILTAATPTQAEWLRKELDKKYGVTFQLTALCLGLRVQKLQDGGYSIDQKHYLVEVLKEYQMLDCKPAPIPVTKGEVDALIAGETGGKPLGPQDHATYRQIIGKLMYAMVGSRPDLAYALSVLGRHAAAPDTYHLAMARRALAYVKGTLDYKLHYPGPSKSTPVLSGYVDSDWANSPDRKSTSGFVFFIDSCLVVWCSKKQVTIATSTTVAEYFAMYEATTEAVCLRNLLDDLQIPQKGPTLLREDNQTAIKLAEDETAHKRTKHIDVKYKYTREEQERGTIRVEYVSSEENLADFFTKPLAHVQFVDVCKQLGLHH